MRDLEKLADVFESKTNDDIFGKISYSDEAKKLYMLAGKLYHKAKTEKDSVVAERIIAATKLMLSASDILKNI